MKVRELSLSDIGAMWSINQQGLPGTGAVSSEEMADLLTLAELALGVEDAGNLLGFVLCLNPGTRYGSLNYAWFNERYENFIYVDRIAVAPSHRSKGIGSALYREVVEYSQRHMCPIAAEVSLDPPNPGSMRFHGRFHFDQVGILEHEDNAVTMMLRSSVKA